jgi:hypothetical protein
MNLVPLNVSEIPYISTIPMKLMARQNERRKCVLFFITFVFSPILPQHYLLEGLPSKENLSIYISNVCCSNSC